MSCDNLRVTTSQVTDALVDTSRLVTPCLVSQLDPVRESRERRRRRRKEEKRESGEQDTQSLVDTRKEETNAIDEWLSQTDDTDVGLNSHTHTDPRSQIYYTQCREMSVHCAPCNKRKEVRDKDTRMDLVSC